MSELPWMRWYATDALESIADMTNEQAGAYLRLLFHQWARRGRLPIDLERVARLANVTDSEHFERLWKVIGEKFSHDETGIYNPRGAREFEEATCTRDALSAAGRRGGRKRSQAKARLKPGSNKKTRTSSSLASVRASDSDSPSGSVSREGGGGVGAEVPEDLRDPVFLAAWADWQEYRRAEKGKPVTPMSAKRQLDALAKVGPQAAVEAINEAIRNGWQGVFPEKLGRSGAKSGKHRSYEDELEAQHAAFAAQRRAAQ